MQISRQQSSSSESFLSICISLLKYSNLSLRLSLLHSLFVSVLGSILILGFDFTLIKTLIIDSIQDIRTPIDFSPSLFHYLILLISIIYYGFDSLILLQNPSPSNRENSDYNKFLLFHHGLCIVGLAIPIFSNTDSILILVGFLLGELSNPPRLLALLLEQLIKQIKQDDDLGRKFNVNQLENLAQFTNTIHFVSFIIFRLIALQWIFRILISRYNSISTLVISISMMVFTAGVIYEYMKIDNNASKTILNTLQANRMKAARERLS